MGDQRARRRWERHDVRIPINVSTGVNGQTVKFSGEACDISIGGLRLFLTREVQPGASLIMEFLLPYSSTPLAVHGVVRNRSGFTHGIEFTHTTSEQQQLIERTCKVFTLLK